EIVFSRSLAPAAADHCASRSRRACSIAFVSDADAAQIKKKETKKVKLAKPTCLLFMRTMKSPQDGWRQFFSSLTTGVPNFARRHRRRYRGVSRGAIPSALSIAVGS